MWRKGTPQTVLIGMQIGVLIMENGMEIQQKIKNRTIV